MLQAIDTCEGPVRRSAPQSWVVYVLSDPRDGRPRYVGTTLDPRNRRAVHVNRAKRGERMEKDLWVASLLADGVRLDLTVVERVAPPYTEGRACTAEARWIARLMRAGAPLLNVENVTRACAAYGLPCSREVASPEGLVLLAYVDRRELSMTDTATAIGVSSVAVQNWIRGRTRPTPRLRARVEAWSGGAVPASVWS